MSELIPAMTQAEYDALRERAERAEAKIEAETARREGAELDRDAARAERDVAEAKLAEAERQRDLAIAHDRQPYPTPAAYEAVFAANEDQRQKLAEVRALAEKWRYKGEHGWGPWQEGYGPGPEDQVLDGAAGELLRIVDRRGDA